MCIILCNFEYIYIFYNFHIKAKLEKIISLNIFKALYKIVKVYHRIQLYF